MPKTKRQKVSFIATKYKNQKVRVDFYTQRGKKVIFGAVKKVPHRQRVEFFVERKKKK